MEKRKKRFSHSIPGGRPEKALREAEDAFLFLLSLGKGYKGYQDPNKMAKTGPQP